MIEIAPLLVTDFDDWRPLWRAYLTFYNSSAEDTTARMTFARLTSGEKPMEALIARDVSSAAVGIVHWIAHPSC